MAAPERQEKSNNAARISRVTIGVGEAVEETRMSTSLQCVCQSSIATGRPHPLNAPFGLERFTTGALIDEHGAAAVAH